FVNRRKDGSLYDEECTISPVRDDAGRTVSYVAVKRDLTRQLALERQLQQAQKMEVLGRLAGGVAHDFNNLLTIILGQAELAQTEAPDRPALAERLRAVSQAGERAVDLTRQLLTFSREQPAEARVVSLNEVVADTRKMLGRLLGERVEVVTALAPDLGPVRADPGHLSQVVLNLAVNARDAMAGGGTLTLATADVELGPAEAAALGPSARPGPYAVLAVSDTGCGMDEETRSRIFEPFFTTKAPGHGTGLGLATVWGLVERAGGVVGVESEPGRGATFRVWLPRAAVAPAPAPRPARSPGLPRGTETVLVAEDDAAVRGLTRHLLERLGYRVLEAPDGDAALALSRAHGEPIQLLLTDVMMPRRTGPEVARVLSAERPGLKVLYASGYAEGALAARGEVAPGLAFLHKPYSREALARAVRQALDGAGVPA
ncbi:MAG: ATP-binding protein, partial [Deferrisomatales bacterium]